MREFTTRSLGLSLLCALDDKAIDRIMRGVFGPCDPAVERRFALAARLRRAMEVVFR